MAKENIFIINELIKDLGISEEVIKKIEDYKIIVPMGVTKDRIPFYSGDNKKQFLYIKNMFELGYTIEEIQRIVKKVGFPKGLDKNQGKGVGKLLTVGDLAAKVDVSIRTIKHWEEKGIIESDMRSDGGFRLFSESYIYLCKLILDLQLFGYSLSQIKTISGLFREFLKISNDQGIYSKEMTLGKIENMNIEIMSLKNKITLFKEGITRWEELLAKKKKELHSIKKSNEKRQDLKKKEKNDLSKNL